MKRSAPRSVVLSTPSPLCTRGGCRPTHPGTLWRAVRPPERLSAVGEDGCPPVLMFYGPLLARVLIGVDVVAVSVLHIPFPASLGSMPHSLGPGHGHHTPNFGENPF